VPWPPRSWPRGPRATRSRCGSVVLGQLGDRFEEGAAALVVEVLARQLGQRPPRQALADFGGHRLVVCSGLRVRRMVRGAALRHRLIHWIDLRTTRHLLCYRASTSGSRRDGASPRTPAEVGSAHTMPLCLLAAALAADLVLLGGRIHTLDPNQPEATALLIRNERILAVGTEAESSRRRAPGSCSRPGRPDRNPGLIDTHTTCSKPCRAGWRTSSTSECPPSNRWPRPSQRYDSGRPPRLRGSGSWATAGGVEVAGAALHSQDGSRPGVGRSPVYLVHVSGHAARSTAKVCASRHHTGDGGAARR